MEAGHRSPVLAFIDIGTNSVRLTVAALHDDRAWTVLTQQKETVRLGEGEFGEHAQLQPEALDRALAVCARFAELARAHGASETLAAATAAVREAENRDVFVRRARDEAGLQVHVVSGAEEARLIYLGVLSRVHVEDAHLLVVDIGGGSTEIAAGDAAGAESVESLRLGAIRLAALEPLGEEPVGRERYQELRRHVELSLAPIARRVGTRADAVAFGTSGTIVNLAAVAARRAGRQPAPDEPLTRKDLRAVVKLLRGLSLEERRRVPGLNPARADLILPGAAILETVMDELGVRRLTALSGCGLREGLVMDHLARLRPDEGAGSVRERSVLRLAHVTGGVDAHAGHVAALALQLFDSAREAGVHELGVRERELLRYAALLHDIGTLLSYSDHERHTYYLIRNADLLGFDQEELALMAATARFHRKALPRARHDTLRELDPADRRAVRVLSLFLRLAEVLDRGHTGAVREVRLARQKARELRLEVLAGADWRLEQWGLERRRATLEKAFAARLRVEARELPVRPVESAHTSPRPA